MSFAACLPIILRSEGGFSDDPQDPGGPTNLGITQSTLSAWLRRPATIDEVRALTPATVAPIYEADYYNASHARNCPTGVDLMVFDEAVNQGVGVAIRSLQTAAGVAVDGLFGPATQAAVAAASPSSLIDGIAADRDDRYRALSKFPVFGAGWLARVERTRVAALLMANAAAAVPAQAG